MDQVDILHVGKYMYCSEVSCCTITAHLRGLEVMVMGNSFLIDLATKHKSGELRCHATALIHYMDSIIPLLSKSKISSL